MNRNEVLLEADFNRMLYALKRISNSDALSGHQVIKETATKTLQVLHYKKWPKLQ